MWNKQALHEQCFKHKIEFAEDQNNRVIFICPRMPNEKIKISLVKMLPESIEYQFMISPKFTTMESLKALLQDVNFRGTMDSAQGFLKIKGAAVIPDDSFWTAIEEVLIDDDYFTGWEITLGSKTITYDKVIAEEVQRNNKRDHSITPDEFTDLKISLGKKQDVNDFLKEMFPDETDRV